MAVLESINLRGTRAGAIGGLASTRSLAVWLTAALASTACGDAGDDGRESRASVAALSADESDSAAAIEALPELETLDFDDDAAVDAYVARHCRDSDMTAGERLECRMSVADELTNAAVRREPNFAALGTAERSRTIGDRFGALRERVVFGSRDMETDEAEIRAEMREAEAVYEPTPDDLGLDAEIRAEIAAVADASDEVAR